MNSRSETTTADQKSPGLHREPAFSLAGMQVSPSTGELVVDGHPTMVQPRIMQVLSALAARRGEVVSRDELIQACWGGRVVGEDAINRCIQAIRRIGREHGGFSIKTVARVGYRLVEAASGADGHEPEHVVEPQLDGASPAPGEGQPERRHLTVLACNLVRGAGMTTPADPEEWRTTIERYRLTVTACVAPFGGQLVECSGDNFLICFGYPAAREDAAECAVRAGLAIVERLKATQSPDNQAAPHGVRVGIHAGVVVAARNGPAVEIYGEAPDVAVQLRNLAAPDTVVMTSVVKTMVAGLFLTAGRGRLTVGSDPSAQIHEVVSPMPASGRGGRNAARALTPYTARNEELQLLSRRWDSVRRGEGQLVLLLGEPGIGKTRLLHEFRARLEGDVHTWIECAGEPLVSNTPFHAAGRMLEQGLRWRSDETAAARLDALEHALERSGLEVAEAAPLVGELLNLPLPDKYPPLALSSDEKRGRLLACLTAWVLSLARLQPLILVVEDLHWIDPSTMGLLQTLIEQVASGPLMILCTARPEFRPGWGPQSHRSQITLDRLSPSETQDLVMGLVPQDALREDVINAVIHRADGVPLFAEELTRWILEGGGTTGLHDIPETLHDSLTARLDRTGSAKEVAQLGAVIGREFSWALITAISSLSADQLLAELSKLAEADLIQVRGHPPHASYRFKHALIRDAAYEGLLKSRRRELHALTARAIGLHVAHLAEVEPEVLARHWSEAGDADKAAAAWTKAAAAAAGRHAYSEAIGSYRRALANLETLPPTPERDERELALIVSLSEIVGVVHGYPSDQYRELQERGAVLAETRGDLPQLVVQLLMRSVNTLLAGHHVRAAEIADQLLSLARREGSDASLRVAETAQVTGRHGVGDFVGAEAHFRAWRRVVRRSGYGQFAGETAAVYGAAVETAYQLGRPDLAQRRLADMKAAAEASRAPFDLMLAHLIEAWLSVLLRDPPAALSAATEALAIAEAQAFQQTRQIRSSLAWALGRLGHTAEALGLAQTCLSGWVGGGFPRLPEARRVMAEMLAINGQLSDALAELDALCAAPTENPGILCAHLICRAELRVSAGREELAEADLRRAISLAQSRKARAMELRSSLHLAEILRSRGDITGARALLAPVFGSFEEGADTADLKDAAALLDTLAVQQLATAGRRRS